MKGRSFFKNLGLAVAGLFVSAKINAVTEKLPKKVSLPPPSFKNQPEEQNMVQFAKEFADNYKLFSPGYYQSDCGTHKIKYCETVTDKNGTPIPFGAQIDHHTKEIQLDKSAITGNEKIDTPFVFFNHVVLLERAKHPKRCYCRPLKCRSNPFALPR